jgi:hypothetical protein
MKKSWTGSRYKTASGRESYEVSEAGIDFLTQIDRIVERLGFTMQGMPLVGLDQVFARYSKGEVSLTTGWDNWSGCLVFADQPAGGRYVIEVGEQVDTLLEEVNREEGNLPPGLSDDLIDDALELALGEGEHYLRAIDDRLMAMHPSLEPDEAWRYDQICREIRRFAFDQFEQAYLKKVSREDAIRSIRRKYVMIGEKNLARLEDQGMERARREHG